MSAFQIFTQPSQQALDTAANVLSGATLTFTLTGTSTPTNAYSDSTLSTPVSNPLSADAAGVFIPVFLDPAIAYRAVLKTQAGAVLKTWDPANENLISYFTQALIGSLLYPTTSAETSASMTPVNKVYPPGDSRRMSPDTTGVTDVTTKLQNLLDAAGRAALAAGGDVSEVTVYPGTYKVTRLYMNYSNVWLRLMPGAVIKQTQTGITNSNTTGVAPAYACIHIHPLSYLANPASGAAGTITNVRIYGGGTLQGPYTTTHAYDGFALGIASNDCHACHVTRVTIQGFGGENILLNPSGWTTCTDLRIVDCEVMNGGETGINNARDFAVTGNYVHDSWSQNGVGGNGDGGVVAFNRIRSMAQSGMSIGGSGARDVTACRNVLVAFNSIFSTCQTTNGYALFLSDDGATTTPKIGLRFIGNEINVCNIGGGAIVGCDYAMATGTVDFEHNFISGGTTSSTASGWVVISGSCRYNLRDNTFTQGSGNYQNCMDVLGGTPVVNVWSYDNRDVATDFLTAHLPLFTLIDVQRLLSGQFTLTGCTTAPAVNWRAVKRGKSYVLEIDGVTAASNSVSCGLSGLPAELFPGRTLNFRFPIVKSGVNLDGILQITAAGAVNLFTDINAAAFLNDGLTKGTVGPYSITVQMT